MLIFATPRDSHALALKRRLQAGGCATRIADFSAVAFDSTAPAGLRVEGMAEIPSAVLVRTMSGGSFEAVTRRLGVLHALEAEGVLVWNSARAIERCVDKSMTTHLLARAGVPAPPSFAVETAAQAAAIAARELAHGPLVLKPLFGSQGRGLKLITAPADLPPPEEVQGVYYLQRFAGNGAGGFHDYRVFVSAGRAIAAMRRRSDGWITNVQRGGRPEKVELMPDFASLATRAARAVGADFCGVDIICPPDGAPMVLEVNSMPAWQGLQQVADIDIAHCLADGLLEALAAKLEGRPMASHFVRQEGGRP